MSVTRKDRYEIQLPSGAVFPDWSVVTAPAAEEAMHSILEAFGARERHNGLSRECDAARRAVIQGYVALGRAPTAREVAESARLPRDVAESALEELERRDLLVRDGGEIVGAYPFTSRATEHHVTVGNVTVNAMCAVDALGVGAMLDRDVRIRSACRGCGRTLELTTAECGKSLGAVPDPPPLVWTGSCYQERAATSLCTVIAFFCQADHLAAWRAEHRDLAGYGLSLDEAMQVGRAIFAPRLTSGGL